MLFQALPEIIFDPIVGHMFQVLVFSCKPLLPAVLLPEIDGTGGMGRVKPLRRILPLSHA
jgi:hypothetical protein